MASGMGSGMIPCRYRRSAVVGVELGELVDDGPSKEPLAGALEAADAAHVRNLSSAEPLWKQVHDEVVELPDAIVFDARHGF